MQFQTGSYHQLQAHLEDGVLTLTLDNPEARNALTVPMMEDLRLLLDCARVDPEVRCLVITGTGKSFCAGGDVRKMAEGAGAAGHPMNRPTWNVPTMPASERLEQQQVTGLRVMRALWELEKPSIAAINGDAVAAGLDLALVCDLRLAADTARLGCTYTRVGLIPFDGAMWWLPRLLGMGKALELMYLGDLFSAAEALQLGLVNRVVPATELAASAAQLARRLATGPAVAYGLTKHIAQRSLQLDFPDALNLAYTAKDVVYATEDHKNAVAAFLAKRAPEFQGR